MINVSGRLIEQTRDVNKAHSAAWRFYVQFSYVSISAGLYSADIKLHISNANLISANMVLPMCCGRGQFSVLFLSAGVFFLARYCEARPSNRTNEDSD